MWADIFLHMGGTEIGACAISKFWASSLLLWHPFRLLMTFADKLKSYLIKTAELLFQFCCAEILTYCLLTSFSWHWPLYQLLVGFYLSWPDFVCASAWGHRRHLFRGLTAVTAPWHTASCVCQCRNYLLTWHLVKLCLLTLSLPECYFQITRQIVPSF